MCNLNIPRITAELDLRLCNAFGNREIEKIMKERCLNAIKNKTLANLYDPIKLSKKIEDHYYVLITSVNEAKIVSVLTETGVHDLICMCINAQA